MAIPKYHEIMPNLLKYLENNGMQYWRDLESPLAKEFNLSSEELSLEYESGNGLIFLDRISWALTHLTMSKLIERPKRGHYVISKLGKEYVGKADELKKLVKEKRFEKRKARKRLRIENEEAEISLDQSERTPHENLNQAFEDIRSDTYETILDTIISKTPFEFEKLVVKLLTKMGYGGQVKEPGKVTPLTNDGGIDGIVKEDVLGLGKIYIQAKRYDREKAIGRQDIQKFVGALAVTQSQKGVFITTSSYKQTAMDYVESLNGNPNLVLIDGIKLAEYIFEYNLGMQTEQIIELKKMDVDFWDAMQDNVKG